MTRQSIGKWILGFYGGLARWLHAYRFLLWCLVAFAVTTFLGSVFWAEPSAEQPYALGSIVLLLWALSLVVVAQAFAVPAPELDPRARLGDRIRIRVARAFRWFMAASTTGLFCFVILLSFKTVGLFLRG